MGENVYHIDPFGSAVSEIGPPQPDAMLARVREYSAETAQRAAPEKHVSAEVLAKARFRRLSAGARIVGAQPKTETAALLRQRSRFFSKWT
jgi:hypothetical protein